jgi:hypothetical protein
MSITTTTLRTLESHKAQTAQETLRIDKTQKSLVALGTQETLGIQGIQ